MNLTQAVLLRNIQLHIPQDMRRQFFEIYLLQAINTLPWYIRRKSVQVCNEQSFRTAWS